MRHRVFSLFFKLAIICVIGFCFFVLGRGFDHFPKKGAATRNVVVLEYAHKGGN